MRSPTPMRIASATVSAVSHDPVRSPRNAVIVTSASWSATAATTTSAARERRSERERRGHRGDVDDRDELDEARRRAPGPVDEPDEERTPDGELREDHREHEREGEDGHGVTLT